MKKLILLIIIVVVLALYFLSLDFDKPESFTYGVSFSRFHSDELNLDWKEVYSAILNDLEVKNLRLSAHWQIIEPGDGNFDFNDLDFQMKEAKSHNVSVILAVGRRLPGWPECHEPDWAKDLPIEQKQAKILEYIQTVVNRYKDYDNIKYWQVENEPYLTFFSKAACGDLDEEFLKKEIELVKSLDSHRQILVTDSGEFGTWYKAYQRGDVFGTSMYLYVWWQHGIGPIRYPITPGFFRIKRNLMNILYGHKPSMIIELSAEPWLLHPIVETSIDIQLSRMGIDKFNEVLDFSKKTGFDTAYLWGAEWWYYMNQKGHPEFWEKAKDIFAH